MRKFKLKNANGFEYDLNNKRAFLTFPEGLGTEREHNYMSLGMNYRLLNTDYIQRIPSGILSVSDYESFSEFAEFIRREPLTLCYQPSSEWYYIDCDLAYLNKGEISQETARLECAIGLNAKGTWYKEPVVLRCGIAGETAGKIYNYAYPYAYMDNRVGSITYNNKSNLKQHVKLIIDGPAVNPGWLLLQGTEVLLTGKVNITLEEEQRLVVNADPKNYEIAVYTKNNVYIRDVKGKSDFSTKRYVVLPEGESILNFTNEADNVMTAYMEVKERYELV